MRVAMLTFFPLKPTGESVIVKGGIRMVALNLVRGLQAYPDLELHVIHCHSDMSEDRAVLMDGILADGLRTPPVTVRYLAMPSVRIVPNLTRSIGRLGAELEAIRPDLVHAHAAHFAYAGARAGYPTLFTIHGVLARQREIYRSSLFDRLRYGLLAHYETRALRAVQKVVAISPYVVQQYAHLGSASWARVDNPVPDEYFHIADRTVEGRVLYVGSTDERKDLLTLLRAIERVRETSPQVRLCIAGHVTSPSYQRRVKEFVAQHRLDEHVDFLGLLDRDSLMEEYAQCALVALASIEENSPMAVIEAMAAAKPVVATRTGGVPDLVRDGETGYLVPVGDDVAMAERMGRLIESPDDRRDMGRRAREVARERFGAGRIARDYYALYRDMVGS